MLSFRAASKLLPARAASSICPAVLTAFSSFATSSFSLPSTLSSSSSSSTSKTPIRHGNNVALHGTEGTEFRQAEEFYGMNVFDRKTMKKYVSSEAYDKVMEAITKGGFIDIQTADAVASGLLSWARERGVTHFSHWFQPTINGQSAEKHDTFLELERDGETPITRFTYKQLTLAEPDGSSFPNGGLRSTHTARGYTVWDPTSSPFVLSHENGATLYIPSLFFSWDQKALDEKIPLLRSEQALRRETLRLFNVLGEEEHKSIHVDSGLEQEFFLVDRNSYLKRPDLMATGRTLFGALPAKGQQMEDQYFGTLSEDVLACLQDFENEMWKLGIPIQTRHREVAPGQYEVAPRFAPSNIATDRNLMLMKMLSKVARRHGLAVLFHEKPFKGVNGSGKHNNWSMGSNACPTLFQPGPNPHLNLTFMFFLAATVRAIDTHGDLMRVAICGAGNDHRLGAQEAPPAIVSVYLGTDISTSVEKFIKGDTSPNTIKTAIDLGVPTIPAVHRATTDRNRTSTFAFTGNKFEFRAVGASHNPARSNHVLNLILADSIRAMTDEIAALLAKGVSPTAAKEQVARKTLDAHKRILFDGNGYSKEWREEAAKRGLPILNTTTQALATFTSPKNVKLYSTMKVFSEEELEARANVLYEDYITRITIEANLTAHMVQTLIAPAVTKFQQQVATTINSVKNLGIEAPAQTEKLRKVTDLLQTMLTRSAEVVSLVQKAHNQPSHQEKAKFLEKQVVPLTAKVREAADVLEYMIPQDQWPLPTYHELLFAEPH